MEVVHPICCGIDVHKEVLVACLRRVVDGKVEKEARTFNTYLADLQQFLAWLTEMRCPIVAMESTGVYWKPVYHVLSTSVDVVVGNAREIKQRPGKKTDKTDADWISELLAHDLIKPSFIPAPETTALRDLTRTRTTLVQNRSQAKNRVHKVLEDTNIKLSCVATDIFGISGRQMLDALISGERDAKRLSEMAVGRLRKKIPQLELALAGQFTEHHAALIKMSLCQIDLLNNQIAEIDEHIAHLAEPLNSKLNQVISIPGVEQTAARAILSEIGADMSRFGSDGRLCSWAGVCPGNNESAGKRRSGKTRKGNRWLRSLLVQCAWAARKTSTFLGRTFYSLQARIGGKKAAMAVAHKILVIIYHLLTEGTVYEERYNHPNSRLEERRRERAVNTLKELGYSVVLEAKVEAV